MAYVGCARLSIVTLLVVQAAAREGFAVEAFASLAGVLGAGIAVVAVHVF